jgi:hypothetical protein
MSPGPGMTCLACLAQKEWNMGSFWDPFKTLKTRVVHGSKYVKIKAPLLTKLLIVSISRTHSLNHTHVYNSKAAVHCKLQNLQILSLPARARAISGQVPTWYKSTPCTILHLGAHQEHEETVRCTGTCTSYYHITLRIVILYIYILYIYTCVCVQ